MAPYPPARGPNLLKNRPPIKAPPPIVGQRKKTRQRICPNKTCNSTAIEEGTCTECGTIIEESNIVSEVQFGETSSGAAMVQGTYVGADQGGASSGGIGGRGDGQNQKAKTVADAKNLMNSLGAQLGVNQSTIDAGLQIFKLASIANFIQGRSMETVAVVCLYTACRQNKPCKVMLIDFADKIQINVFRLGAVFKGLHKEIPTAVDGLTPVIPEDLIHRFASKLEFNDMTDKVAEDAIRMVQRMSLDWMVMGRRPSGVCGACLILAARMNNFRRTVTEVVYIVKVTTATIQKRLEEFKMTPSSALTVEEFLHNEFLESAHDPPSFYEKTEEFQATKKKRTRKRKNHDRMHALEAENEGEGSGSEAGSPDKRQKTAPPAQQGPLRRDADGFAIPHLPNRSNSAPPPVDPESNIDPALRAASGTVEASTLPGQAAPQLLTPPATQNAEDPVSQDPENTDEQTGTTIEALVSQFGDLEAPDSDEAEPGPAFDPANPRKGKKGPDNRPIQVSEDWDKAEKDLEQEIGEMVNDPNSLEHAFSYATAQKKTNLYMLRLSRETGTSQVSMDVHVGEDEFKDDPEILNCLLSPEDIKIRELVWLNLHKDYLRKQQVKLWEKRQAENGPPKAKRNRTRTARMGEGQTEVAESPGEAAADALKRRSTAFSKKINYDTVRAFLDHNTPGSMGSAATSRVTSRAGSEVPSEAGSGASSVGLSDPMDIFKEQGRSYTNRKRKASTPLRSMRESPVPRAIAPRPSAEPDTASMRGTPAPSEVGDESDYVSESPVAKRAKLVHAESEAGDEEIEEVEEEVYDDEDEDMGSDGGTQVFGDDDLGDYQ